MIGSLWLLWIAQTIQTTDIVIELGPEKPTHPATSLKADQKSFKANNPLEMVQTPLGRDPPHMKGPSWMDEPT